SRATGSALDGSPTVPSSPDRRRWRKPSRSGCPCCFRRSCRSGFPPAPTLSTPRCEPSRVRHPNPRPAPLLAETRDSPPLLKQTSAARRIDERSICALLRVDMLSNTARTGGTKVQTRTSVHSNHLKTILFGTVAAFLVLSLLLYPEQAFDSALKGLKIWWDVVFPALLPDRK